LKKILLKANILERVKLHRQDSPVYSAELERLFDITGAEVRDSVRELRREGYPIANSSNGYYYADSFEQIRNTVEDLEGRASSMLKTASALRKTFNRNIQIPLFK